MKRRGWLGSLLGAVAALAVKGANTGTRGIELHLDLKVDPAKEKQMLHNFDTIFRPEAMKHEGYIDVKMLKLRSALQGSAPEGVNYRFTLAYQSEELRQKWIASDAHRRVWPTVEKMLQTPHYTVLLFDQAE